MLPFFVVLLALLLVGMIRSDGRMAGTAAVLLINWLIEVGMITLTGEQFPWMLFLTVDYLCAITIAAMASTRWQLAIVIIYAAQACCHAAYGASDGGLRAQYDYWWALTYSGWAQLASMGGWIIYALVGGPGGVGSRLSSHIRGRLARQEDRP